MAAYGRVMINIICMLTADCSREQERALCSTFSTTFTFTFTFTTWAPAGMDKGGLALPPSGNVGKCFFVANVV